MIKKVNLKRMCSFYVSNIHFITMILPYLSEKIGKGENVIAFLEKDLQEEVELLLSKINIKENLKNEIRKINWNKIDNCQYVNIESSINNIKSNNINIFVVGTKEYIDNVNMNIEKYLSKNNGISINEIDAYKLDDNKVNNIINKYEYLLNTSGEFPINEIIKKKEII